MIEEFVFTPFQGGILRPPALREERSLKPPKFIGHLQDIFFLYIPNAFTLPGTFLFLDTY